MWKSWGKSRGENKQLQLFEKPLSKIIKYLLLLLLLLKTNSREKCTHTQRRESERASAKH